MFVQHHHGTGCIAKAVESRLVSETGLIEGQFTFIEVPVDIVRLGAAVSNQLTVEYRCTWVKTLHKL